MSVKTDDRPSDWPASARSSRLGRGMNSAWVRRVNAVLLMRALRRHRGASQRELSALTGLDKATVSAVTAQLEAAGHVVRSRPPSTTRRLGRPAIALDIPRAAGVVFGVRLEPDGIAIVAADLGGRIIDRESRPGLVDPGAALRSLPEALREIEVRLGNVPRRAIGIGVPALIDREGYLVFGPNLGWRDFALAKETARLLPAPVVIENDTNAAAIAEREFGSCNGINDFIYISAHSGVGGAIFARGELYRGAAGLAGEVGHIRVVPGGRPCACGGLGCLEAYASEPALLAMLGMRGRPAANLDEVALRAAGSDPVVLELLAETGVLMGRAVAGLVNSLNPDRLVLGGNVAVVVPWMLSSLRQELARSALPQLADKFGIERSPLGPDAVMMGGVALALQRVDAELLEGANADETLLFSDP